MAVLLRSLGVPSRNVTGFIGGTYNRFAHTYAVRQGDAHSWVEAFLPGRGWTRFDPTPPASSAPRSEIHGLLATVRDIVEAMTQRWNHHVVNYDLKQQIGILRSVRHSYRSAIAHSNLLGRAFASPRRALMSILALAAAVLIGRRLLRRPWRRLGRAPLGTTDEIAARRIVELYRALDAELSSRGVARPSGTPPLTHATALVTMGHPGADEILALTEQYVRVRFGGEAFGDSERRQFMERVRALKQNRPERRAA
jgi:hypothetical protein